MTTDVSDATQPAATGGWLAPCGLIRPREDRHIAGVCAALGRASGTDPLLWRAGLGVLVVFAGTGLLLYGVAWLLFPQEGDEVSALGGLLRRGRSSTSILSTLLLVVMVVTLWVIVLLNPATYPVVSLGAAAMLLSALAQPRVIDAPTSPAPSASTGSAYRIPFAPRGPFARTRRETVAAELPAWDTETTTVQLPAADHTRVEPTPTVEADTEPLETADSAAAITTVPTTPQRLEGVPARRRFSSRLNLLGLAVVSIAMGVMAIVSLSGVAVPGSAFLSVALLLIGVVVMIGTWWGRSRLWIVMGLILSLLVAADYLFIGQRPDGVVNATMVPLTVEEIPSEWSVWFSEADLDLTRVEFSDDVDQTVEVLVRGGSGRVVLPSDVDVILLTSINGGVVMFEEYGDVTYFDGWESYHDLGSEGGDGPGGGTLTIDVTVEFGGFEVVRE
ncbi:phage shock protein C (PspC) family protein [Stackebrandtia endophytica]|uniref:Phage shock protein C (PspC) family protein n=1 Tax=Stackebrandtia endophytica TaxID=1496996 RepID=A0A543AWU8_9ACTN|nr:PspC domain-containing protein [Stackebrandtia endophytica]TQL77055.1 phage shock protein C (PspC) family protein [Stackebrandtia endophytica]